MASNKSTLQFPNKKQFIITVPKGLVLAKGWKQGDILEFIFNDKGNLVMKKVGEKKQSKEKDAKRESEEREHEKKEGEKK